MEIGVPSLGKGVQVGGKSDQKVRLAKSLKEVNALLIGKESVARGLLGEDFVVQTGGNRAHEVRLWNEAVIDW